MRSFAFGRFDCPLAGKGDKVFCVFKFVPAFGFTLIWCWFARRPSSVQDYDTSKRVRDQVAPTVHQVGRIVSLLIILIRAMMFEVGAAGPACSSSVTRQG